MTTLSCKRCTYQWEYTGDRKTWATCPDCKTSVRVSIFKKQEENKVKRLEKERDEEYDKRIQLIDFLADKYPQVMDEYNSKLIREAQEEADEQLKGVFK
jgi:hypothetical protein